MKFMNKISSLKKKITHTYREKLYTLQIDNRIKVVPRIDVNFEKITLENCHLVTELRGKIYLKEFKKMLETNDYGLFAVIGGKPVGYGWAKNKGSKDYFFEINECYLCRFFVSNSYRGLNIYPTIIQELIIKMNKEEGIEKFYIAVENTNKPSIKGISKLGFKFIKEYSFLRILKITLNKKKLMEKY